jgi:arginyl-tRNA synthetase
MMYQIYYTRIQALLCEYTGLSEVPLVDGSPHADLATPVAFALAKTRRQSPAIIASDLAERLTSVLEAEGISVEASGPYINFRFGHGFIRASLEEALKSQYGTHTPGEKRLVLEHTSANPNGPLHVGHIRNSIIGDTLARCFRKAGIRTEVQYYVNDMGRQIAIVVWGFDHLGITAHPDEKEDHFIARIYITANREIERDPKGITADVDHLMQLVEKGDKNTVKRFRSAVSQCLDGFRITMARLNVHHDRFVWESDFVRNGDTDRLFSRIHRLPEYHEDGKAWLDLSAAGFDKEYILRRSDGTSVYATRDLAYHIWKGRHYDRMIDVLGADHKLIGAQLIATLALIGEKTPVIVHFEFVSLPEGSMSTRAGKFVSADELMDEVTNRAYEEVAKRRPDLDGENLLSIARSVAISAIRYDIVKVSPDKATVFDWKEALDFERQSGPYIQYAHARACSILDKAGSFTPEFEFSDEYEIALAKCIARFPSVIDRVVTELRPHLLAAYAREIADLFNTFYHFEPVLKAEGITRQSRLTLVKATQNTLHEALETLGIEALRTM